MATLRETIEAKIASADADLLAMKNELENLKSAGEGILEKEINVITGWYETARKYI